MVACGGGYQEEFEAGDVVVKEGDAFADRFYIVEEVSVAPQ